MRAVSLTFALHLCSVQAKTQAEYAEELTCFWTGVANLDFWNHLRNNLAAFAISQPRVITKEVFEGFHFDYFVAAWERMKHASACLLGNLAMMHVRHFLSPFVNWTISADDLVSHFQSLKVSWWQAVWSGWPIFNLLARSDYHLGTFKGLEILQTLLDEALVALRAAREDPQDMATTAMMQALLPRIHLALSTLERRGVRGRRVWSMLAVLQRELRLKSACPYGSHVAEAMAGDHVVNTKVSQVSDGTKGLPTRHFMCIRFGIQDQSSVDVTLRYYGVWSDCNQVLALTLSEPFNMIQRRCTVLDVGANIGACAALLAAVGFPVIAVEPQTYNMQMLRATAALPELLTSVYGEKENRGSIQVHWGAAVAAASKRVSIFSPMIHAGGARLATADEEADAEHSPGLTIDSLVDGLRDVCLVKIDVEGAELQALRGASRLLSRGLKDQSIDRNKSVAAIFFEAEAERSKSQGESTAKLFGLFRRYGYRLYDWWISRDGYLVSTKLNMTEAILGHVSKRNWVAAIEVT